MQNNPEEVDILQFFSALGKIFQNIYNAIKNLLKNIFYYLLDGFLYLKKHYLYLTAGFLVGLILSFLVPKEEFFVSSARVRTNFDSQFALLQYVNLFNELIKNEDYAKLSEVFNIDEATAEHLTLFELKPAFDDVLILEDYEEFLKKKDTVVYKFIKFENYKESIYKRPLTNKYWSIKVYSDQPVDFSFLNSSFANLFNKDEELLKRKENILFVLETEKQKYLKSLQDIDSLRSVYNQVVLNLAKSHDTNGASTNIILNYDNARSLESSYNLFSERYRVLSKLEKLSEKFNKYSDVLIFLNDFSPTPIKDKKLINNVHFKFSMFGFLLVLLVFLGKDFIAFLNRYQQQKEN